MMNRSRLLICFTYCITTLISDLTIQKLLAQENILGVPVPVDPRKPGSIVLHGGARVSDEVFDRFVELAGGPQAEIVFVPSAGFRRGWYESDDEMIEALSSRYSSWVELENSQRIQSFQFLFTDEPQDAEDEDFCKPLESATGVWFSGGEQSRLNYRFVGNYPERTRFQRMLENILRRGGAIGGTSAGMAAIPEIMIVSDDQDESSGPVSAFSAHGFGLIRHAIVDQHFDARSGRLERFTGLLRDNARLDQLAERNGAGPRMIGLAVEEAAALVIRGNQLEAIGEANSHVFLKSASGKSIAWHNLSPGDSAQLSRRPNRSPSLDFEQNVLLP
jgi:cyanophycinase